MKSILNLAKSWVYKECFWALINYFTIRSDGLEHGSRSRLELTSQDFGDLGACLFHHTLDQACRPVDHSGYISTLSLIGKSVV